MLKSIINLGENALVLFKRIDYGKKLVEKLDSMNIQTHYVDGSVGVSDRESVRVDMELNTGVIAVCSYGTFSTGINIRNLHNLVFASTTKAEIKVLQSIGRSLRLHPSKKTAIVWDLVDNLKYRKRNNYSISHFMERNNIYRNNGFNVTYKNIELK